MEMLKRNFPYGKKDLTRVKKGTRISLVYNDSIEEGFFHSVEGDTVKLSYAGGWAVKGFPLDGLRSFAIL